ncbi:MAG: DNA methyltransferase [Hydrogenophaga sp.]|nr:DNA methyltransferase [Hydrogenophaga sp.]
MPVFNQEHIRSYRFKQLFNELGWDAPAQQQPYSVAVGDDTWLLDVVALKKGVQVLHCRPGALGQLPDYATRQKIERKITPDVREHLIVFTNEAKTIQVWQWVTRQAGKPVQYREVFFRQGEAPELLTQKLSRLNFTLDEEELLTVLGVTARLDDAAPRDKVTKKFYGEFEKQRRAFAAFIEGIPADSEDQRWYTAVVIDRLMFLWFLQEKNFLDNQPQYLQQRLQAHLDGGHTQSFYKRFLSPLFFKGFAQERTPETAAAIQAEFGKVPYLNGGLFAQHELEERYGEALDIADNAFQKLFAFFDEWEWHLDERPLKSGKEINPDVLGYIFEKFVNQKQMGAYYTKEDITEYIGKNTIIPALLGKVRAEHPAAFDALAWPLLQHSGDAYIYPAMLKGVDVPYPTEIASGLDTEAPDLLTRRKPWKKRADDAVSLPTEIWRETIARHQRTREVRAKLAAGDLKEVGDLITWNLNIRQFAQDLIEGCTDVALLKSFWFNLAGRLPRRSTEKFRHGLSVLDPTCGSGAFLFAALNILKPLYDATLRTLQAVRADALMAGDTSHPETWAEVDELLARFAAAGSDRAQDYAVIKHIVVHNLYGVDIEKQATEIAKLRLFLKLVALLEPGDDIEPLPDIDFNIRHGNTLVGYATADETEKAVKGATQGNLFSDAWEDIRIRLVAVEQQYNNFQIQQVQRGGHVSAADKRALVDTLYTLEKSLNHHLAKEHGVDPVKTKSYEKWRTSHQPFHWYVDFYPLMAAGGFDVIVGNPPYAEVPKDISRNLLCKSFSSALEKWSRDEDLYTFVVERSLCLMSAVDGEFGMILPLSLAFSTKKPFVLLRSKIAAQSGSWAFSHFDRIPSSLFSNEVRTRCTIALCSSGRTSKDKLFLTTPLLRWNAEYRAALFPSICYSMIGVDVSICIPKVASQEQADVLAELQKFNRPLSRDLTDVVPFESLLAVAPNFPQPCVYIGGTAYNWFPAWRDIPDTFTEDGQASLPARTAGYRFASEMDANLVFALLCSSLGYWWWAVASDGFNLKKWLLERFPVSSEMIPIEFRKPLAELGAGLRVRLKENYVYKDNKGRIGNFYLPGCEQEVRCIDELLVEAVPILSKSFFESVRAFNMSFSRVQVSE